jgi:hypothetical protein
LGRDQTVAVDYEVVIADYLGVILSIPILTSSKMIQDNAVSLSSAAAVVGFAKMEDDMLAPFIAPVALAPVASSVSVNPIRRYEVQARSLQCKCAPE